jgi:hypothetical protein
MNHMRNDHFQALLEREFGLDELDAQSRSVICGDLGEIIADRLYLMLSRRLSAEDLRRFDDLLARTDADDETSAFLGKTCPEYAEMIRSIIADLKRSILEASSVKSRN